MEISQDKTIQAGNIKVNYKIAGQGPVILILHGWGSSSDSWTTVQDMLVEKGYQVVVPDLPGFGKTPAPSTVWGVEEYAGFVNQFIESLELQKCILASHSFGGQTAIQFATTYPEKLEKLILIAPAGIRHEPGLKIKVLAFIARMVPKFIKRALSLVMPSSDYRKSQGIMKDIMKKVIRQDLTAKFSQIKVPTLIIWGDKDKMTPVQDAYVMKERIPNSKLEILPGVGHRIKNEVPEKLVTIIWFWLS